MPKQQFPYVAAPLGGGTGVLTDGRLVTGAPSQGRALSLSDGRVAMPGGWRSGRCGRRNGGAFDNGGATGGAWWTVTGALADETQRFSAFSAPLYALATTSVTGSNGLMFLNTDEDSNLFDGTGYGWKYGQYWAYLDGFALGSGAIVNQHGIDLAPQYDLTPPAGYEDDGRSIIAYDPTAWPITTADQLAYFPEAILVPDTLTPTFNMTPPAAYQDGVFWQERELSDSGIAWMCDDLAPPRYGLTHAATWYIGYVPLQVVSGIRAYAMIRKNSLTELEVSFNVSRQYDGETVAAYTERIWTFETTPTVSAIFVSPDAETPEVVMNTQYSYHIFPPASLTQPVMLCITATL